MDRGHPMALQAVNTGRVLIVDSRSTVQTHLLQAFEAHDEIEQVRHYPTSTVALRAESGPKQAGELPGTLLVLELIHPFNDCLELVRRFSPGSSSATVLVLGDPDQGDALARAVELGAGALVTRTSPPDRIFRAASRMRAGAVVIDPELFVPLMRSADWLQPSRQRLARIRSSLSSRETSVLSGLARGWTDDEITASLGSDPVTVRTHLVNALRKLGVTTRAAGVLFAVRYGVIPLQPPSGDEIPARSSW